MRPKVFLAVLLGGCLLLGMLLIARQRGATAPESPSQRTIPEMETGASNSLAKVLGDTGIPAKRIDPASPEHNEDISSTTHRAYVDSRVNELMELAMTDDPASLDTILSELTNRDPEIRKAALEASVQFGSRDAIPKLMDVVSQTDDPKEKAEIVEAIEFLKLPSATEIAQTGGAKTTIRRTVKTPKPANATPTPGATQ